MFNWFDSPRYQRQVQRLMAMSPESRKWLNTAMLDSRFGSEEMRKTLWALDEKAKREQRARQLGLAERGLSLRKKTRKAELGLRREQEDLRRKQARLGEYIEMAGIPVSGYFGYKQMQRDIEEANRWNTFMNQYLTDYTSRYESQYKQPYTAP